MINSCIELISNPALSSGRFFVIDGGRYGKTRRRTNSAVEVMKRFGVLAESSYFAAPENDTHIFERAPEGTKEDLRYPGK